MVLSKIRVLSLIVALTAVFLDNALAQWSSDPTVNNAISKAAHEQEFTALTSDGAGGAIITWLDFRDGNWDIYAQRIDASGVARWTTDGVPVSRAVGLAQRAPSIVSDDAGGAIIAWQDYRNVYDSLFSGYFNEYDIYAQRLNSSGIREWIVGTDTDGVAICTALGSQTLPVITKDGYGGAIIAWQDTRDEIIGYNYVFAQRISQAGTVQWPTDGVYISTSYFWLANPVITSDGRGGAIIAFQRPDIYNIIRVNAQLINTAGIVQWGANGVPLSNAPVGQTLPAITTDGLEGAIVAWVDSRHFLSGTGNDIYAQRIDSAGTIRWGDGVVIDTASGDQDLPVIIYDGSGGAIIAWQDPRNGSDNDIYAQRVNYSGAVQWTADGIPISAAVRGQDHPAIATDEAGGAIITWQDLRASPTNSDIYAQHVDPFGNTGWTANGAPVSTQSVNQLSPAITSNGAGGAIIAWSDARDDDSNIYASRILADGALPVELASFHAIVEGSEVKLSWTTATEVNCAGFEVERRGTGEWEDICFVAGKGTSSSPSRYVFIDHNIVAGRYSYRFREIDRDGKNRLSPEEEVEVGSLPASFTLSQNYPNPFNPSTTIGFTLPEDGRVVLKVFDVLGREVTTLLDENRKAGEYQQVAFDGSRLASGVYYYRLQAGTISATKKLVLLK